VIGDDPQDPLLLCVSRLSGIGRCARRILAPCRGAHPQRDYISCHGGTNRSPTTIVVFSTVESPMHPSGVKGGSMKGLLTAACLVSAAVAGPASQPAPKNSVDSDMQRAIAWERYKDMAAARQARKEAKHPSVTYNNNANREAGESTPERKVVDPAPPAVRKK
jgi:hypothetical protein